MLRVPGIFCPLINLTRQQPLACLYVDSTQSGPYHNP